MTKLTCATSAFVSVTYMYARSSQSTVIGLWCALFIISILSPSPLCSPPALSIVGNKNDMEEQREVSQSAGMEFAHTVGAMFTETSAKENVGMPLNTSTYKNKFKKQIRVPQNTYPVRSKNCQYRRHL